MKELLQSSGHELQVDQRMPHFLRFWLFTVAFLLLVISRVQAAEQQHKVEKLMRELQCKYWTATKIGGSPGYIGWPSCGNGPSPRYPKDDFYGDIERDPQMGVALVQAAYGALLAVGGHFTKTTDGITLSTGDPIEGSVDPIPNFSAQDFTFTEGLTSSGDITEENYLSVLSQIKRYNARLQYVPLNVQQVGVGGNPVEYREGGGSGETFTAAKNSAIGNFNDTMNSWQVINNNTDTFRRQLGEWEEASYEQNAGNDYAMTIYRMRGHLTADLQGLSGDVVIFVMLDATVVNGTFGIVADFRELNPFDVSAAMRSKWKIYRQVGADGEYKSDLLANDPSNVAVAVPDMNTPVKRLGWSLVNTAGLFTRDWNHPPDLIDCCLKCSGSCRPGRVQTGVTPGFSINLGTTDFDKTAGDLVINAPYPGVDIANLDYLNRATANGVESDIPPTGVPGYPSGSGVVGQARVPSGILANIASASQGASKLTFTLYKSGDVVAGGSIGSGYQVGASAVPFKTVTFEEVTGVNPPKTKWKLTEEEDGNILIHEWTWQAPNHGWEKVTKNAAGEVFRKERMIVQAIGNNGTVSTPTRGIIRHEFRWRETYITAMMNGAVEVVQDKRSKTIRRLNWGADEIVEETINPDAVNGLTKTTKYTFEDDNNLADDYTRLKRIDYPSGSWERISYDSHGRLGTVVRQFLNNAATTADSANRVTTFTYTENGKLVERVDKLQDIVVGHSFTRHIPATSSPPNPPDPVYRTIKDIVCLTAGAGENDANNLVTISRYDDGPGGELHSVLRPDGVLELHSHSDAANGDRTITVAIGQPNGDQTDIIKGTKSTTTVTSTGKVKSRQVVDAFLGVTIEQELPSSWDDYGRPLIVADLKGRQITYSYNNCCGADQVTDFDGAVTTLKYDELHRLIEKRRKFVKDGSGNTIPDDKDGTTLIYTYDALDRIVQVSRRGTNGPSDSVMVLQTTSFNQGGEVYSESSAAANYVATAYSEQIDAANGNRLKQTITYPDGGNSITLYNQDGSIYTRTGSAVASRKFDYGATADGEYVKTIAVASGGGVGEWVLRRTDLAGRIAELSYPDGAVQTWNYNVKGQLDMVKDPDLNRTLYEYNTIGELERVVGDANRDEAVTVAGNDTITKIVTEVTTASIPLPNTSQNVIRTTVSQHSAANQNVTLEVSRTEQPVSGLDTFRRIGSAYWQRSTSYGANGVRVETEYAPDRSRVEAEFRYGRLASVTKFDKLNAIIEQQIYDRFGDSHGRMRHMIEKRTPPAADVQTDFDAYDSADRIKQVTLPPPVAGGTTRQSYSYDYDNLGRLTKITLPDSTVGAEKAEVRDYFPSGQLKKVSGARVYPVEYTYDTQLRLKTLKTWQDYTGLSGAATTTWNYHPERGYLQEKVYPDNTKTEYTYTAAGRLETRKRPRAGATGGKITTTYGYNDLGLLETVTYNDGTPGQTYTYDRQNRPKTVVRNGITTTFGFSVADQLVSESHSGGTLDGYSISAPVDAYLRRSGVQVVRGAATANQDFSYDDASRLKTVKFNTRPGNTGPHSTATYTYKPYRPLVDHIDVAHADTPVTTTFSHDDLGRLTGLSASRVINVTVVGTIGGATVPTTLVINAHSYEYNLANQKQRAAMGLGGMGTTWDYDYDALGQLTSAQRNYTSGQGTLVNGTAVHFMAGHQFRYEHDSIGNRKLAKTGGDSLGTDASLRVSTYATANNVNQPLSRSVPGYLHVTGQSTPDSTTTVNDGPVSRDWYYFWKELAYDNSAGAVYPLITNTVVMKDSTALSSPTQPEDIVLQRVGRMFLPKTPETFTYSSDGNLTQDGRWDYTWDAENRLVQMVTRTNVLTAIPEVGRRITFEYDYLGRRISKQVETRSGGAWVPQETRKFLYEGWNLVSEYNVVGGIDFFAREYAWGLDLSGTRGGAGGVGGLLMVRDANNTMLAVTHDGNGNVTALTSLEAASTAQSALSPLVRARYAYGPFGELLQAGGPMAFANPFRFSTKYCDDESDLYYYGFRYYNPVTGRWLSRDPIEEAGGVNLYGFVFNNPLNWIDAWGLDGLPIGDIDALLSANLNLAQVMMLPKDVQIQMAHRMHMNNSKLLPNKFQVGIMEFDPGERPSYAALIAMQGINLANNLANSRTPMFPIGGNCPPIRKFSGGARPPAKVPTSFGDLAVDPKLLRGLTADDMSKVLGEGWIKGHYGITGTGWKFTKGDKIVFYHEGGRHVGPYWGLSSGTTGKIKVVGSDYVPLPGDKAKVIKIE